MNYPEIHSIQKIRNGYLINYLESNWNFDICYFCKDVNELVEKIKEIFKE